MFLKIDFFILPCYHLISKKSIKGVVIMAEKVPQEHIDALKETERLKAEGKAEYISYDELKKTMNHVLKEINDAPAV
jgi:hypothetical protein